MRKNDLAEKLQAIEGNPEIKLWNGYVGDVADVGDIGFTTLSKYTLKGYKYYCLLEEKVSKLDFGYKFSEEEEKEIENSYKEVCKDWEYGSYVREEDVQAENKKLKDVLVIQAKNMGKTTWDRAGYISY
jgi:hypothetical protein